MKSLGFKKFILARTADIVSLIHLAVVLVAAFGWWIMPNNPFHFVILVLTLLSWIVIKSCILARLEFWIRSQYLANMMSYESGYLHYHMRRLTGLAPSIQFIRLWGYIYLSAAIVLWIVRYSMQIGVLS